jgi:hypothetical protein
MKYLTVEDIIDGIHEADPCTIYDYLDAVRERFRELYPGWEMAVHNLNLNEDVDAQIDRDIKFMQGLKNFHPQLIPKPAPPEESKKVQLHLLEKIKNIPCDL